MKVTKLSVSVERRTVATDPKTQTNARVTAVKLEAQLADKESPSDAIQDLIQLAELGLTKKL